MTIVLGKFYIDEVITFYTQTHKYDVVADADSAPGARIYEGEVGTPILTPTMATLDASNTDGFYSEELTLSSASGFEYGKSYCIRILPAVDGGSQGELQRFFIKTEAEHKMKRLADLTLFGTVDTAEISNTTTFELTGTGLTDSTADAYKGCFIKVESGNNKYEVRQITASSVVVTNVRFTVDAMQAALANGVTVAVF